MTNSLLKLGISISLALVTSAAHATRMDSVPIDELFSHADFVAQIQIIEGHTLGTPEDDCGALYKGRVIFVYKGSAVKQVEFGHYEGFKVGNRYLVFLTKPNEPYRSLASTNSYSMKLEQEHAQKCARYWTGMEIMQGVHGALEIYHPYDGYTDTAVRLPMRFIAPPEGSKFTPVAAPSSVDNYADPVWILEKEIQKVFEAKSNPK